MWRGRKRSTVLWLIGFTLVWFGAAQATYGDWRVSTIVTLGWFIVLVVMPIKSWEDSDECSSCGHRRDQHHGFCQACLPEDSVWGPGPACAAFRSVRRWTDRERVWQNW
jgi:hypothetical protein